jgi:fructokinase
MATVLTIGELLWDVFPDGAHLGGAPANVAYHLAQAGHRAQLVSAVGDDERGRRAEQITSEGGVDTALVHVDGERPTGVVNVEVDQDGVATFDIARDVAWDHIPWTEALDDALREADAVVFGTLAQRQPTSRYTIRAAVAAAGDVARILDLNLRPPFIDAEVVRVAVEQASILKLNDDEAAALPGLLGIPDSRDALRRIADAFEIERIYITRGPDGCAAVDERGVIERPAPRVTVADTVGAGDAFTAALIDGELRGLEVGDIAENACAVGAYVASQAGATPPWDAALRERLRSGGER